MLESLFNKVARVFSREYCEISKNSYFEKHLQTAASKIWFFLTNRDDTSSDDESDSDESEDSERDRNRYRYREARPDNSNDDSDGDDY